MFDVEIHMKNQPGQLALMGATLGAAEISVEGGGMWLVDGVGVAHFLVEDGERARRVLIDSASSAKRWQTLGSTSRCSTAIMIISSS